jgi:hypothetical protein
LVSTGRQIALPGQRTARLTVNEELSVRYVGLDADGHAERVELGIDLTVATGTD